MQALFRTVAHLRAGWADTTRQAGLAGSRLRRRRAPAQAGRPGICTRPSLGRAMRRALTSLGLRLVHKHIIALQAAGSVGDASSTGQQVGAMLVAMHCWAGAGGTRSHACLMGRFLHARAPAGAALQAEPAPAV